MTPPNVDLRAVARRLMTARGFRVDFPADALAQAAGAQSPPMNDPAARDLTGLLWSSIDNDDSRDLDQLEAARAEPGGTRLWVAIADVDALAPAGSAVDQTAEQNTTSIYTGVETFPMLPPRLSNDLSSLLEGQARRAVVVELLFDADGTTVSSDVYPAVVQNKAQLTYDAVAHWLDPAGPPPAGPSGEALAKIRRDPALQAQLTLQETLARTLQRRRADAGALAFAAAEFRPVLGPDGEPRLSVHTANRATRTIENFMIAANAATVAYLMGKGLPGLRRVVRTPKRWDRIVELARAHGAALPPVPDVKALQGFLTTQQERDPGRFADLSLAVIKLLGRGEYVVEEPGQPPIGHFGLAVTQYAHTTAPNRRYPDLLTQRLLLAAGRGRPAPYGIDALRSLARHCTEREDEANKVERAVRKCLAARAMAHRVGEIFEGLITGASSKGVWVRIAHPPVEGKLEGSPAGLDVGDHVSVRLTGTDAERGFIDFRLVKTG